MSPEGRERRKGPRNAKGTARLRKTHTVSVHPRLRGRQSGRSVQAISPGETPTSPGLTIVQVLTAIATDPPTRSRFYEDPKKFLATVGLRRAEATALITGNARKIQRAILASMGVDVGGVSSAIDHRSMDIDLVIVVVS